MRAPLRVVAVAAVLALLAGPALSASTVALVLDVAGATKPTLEPFSELNANEAVELDPEATVTLLHYGTCEEVLVRGGRLVVTERQYLAQKGKIVKVTRAKCPKKVALAGEARTGGVRLRAGGAGLKMNPRPGFVVVGPAREHATEVAIMHGDEILATHKLDGPRFSWPEGAEPLAPGRDYALKISRDDGKAGEPIEFEVREGEQAMALIQID